MHPLLHEYQVSILQSSNKKNPYNYTETLHNLCTLKYAEELSYILHHIKPFAEAPSYNLNIFKKGIEAKWEDPANKDGCTWTVQFKTEVANIIFERLCVYFCLMGFKTFECNGLRVNVRKGFVKFELWSAAQTTCVDNAVIFEDLQESMGLDFPVAFHYKNHKELLEKVTTTDTQ